MIAKTFEISGEGYGPCNAPVSENVKDFNHNDVHSDKATFNSQSTLGEPQDWEMSGVYWHSAKAATKGM